jgi:hypothetical protein
MFQTLDEGMALYKKELKEFHEWVASIDSYDTPIWSYEEWMPWRPRSEPHGWPLKESLKVRSWKQRLRGMEAALGLAPGEIYHHYQAAGLIPSCLAGRVI